MAKILIVEDYKPILELYKIAFKGIHQVRDASTMEDAEDKLSREGFDFVILDSLTDRRKGALYSGGIAILERIRAGEYQPLNPGTLPALMVSGHEENSSIAKRARMLGAIYLKKGGSIDVVTAISKLLGNEAVEGTLDLEKISGVYD